MTDREAPQPRVHSNTFRVIYDMQNDKYVKVHKQLGTETLVYKDGSELKKFQPGVTGQPNSSRRFHNEQLFAHQTSASPKNRFTSGLVHESQFIVRRKQRHEYQMKTLDPSQNSQALGHHHEPKALAWKCRSENKEMPKILPAITEKDFFKRIVANRERQLKMQQTVPVDELSKTLKKFNELKQDSIYENHSIKQGIPGSSPKRSPDRMHLANKQYFETLANESSASINFFRESKKNKSSFAKLNQLPDNMKLSTQYMRERQLFFKVHPQNREKQKDPDIMRRDNLKRLEREFIEQSARQTSHVYSHD